MRVRVPLCILMVLLPLLSFQTHPQNNVSGRKYIPIQHKIQFRHLDREHGLTNGFIQSLIQDSRGFVWIGTINGLHRYDGVNLKVFRHSPEDPNSMGSNGAMSLFEDRSGTMWVGTNGGGINRYNPEQENFTRYINQDDSSTMANWIMSIYEDSQGEFWAGSFYKGLSKFDPNTGKFVTYKNIPGDITSISENRVWPVHEDKLGNIWVGTFHGGLNKFDREEKKFERYIYDPKNVTSVNNNVITWICGDTSGGIWAATVGGGINKIIYNDKKKPVFKYITREPANPFSLNDSCISTIVIDNKNIMWVGTIMGGLNKSVSDIFSSDSLQFVSYTRRPGDKTGLSNNNVACLYQDNMGLVWVGTWGGGVCVYNTGQKQFRNYNYIPDDTYSLSSNDLTEITEDKSGNIWVGTRDAGLNKWNRQTNKFTRYRHDPDDPNSLSLDRITAIYADSSNILWVGAYNKGLNRLDIKSGDIKVYQHDPFNSNSINYDAISCIAEDKYGMIWIGSEYDGLTRFDRNTGSFKNFRYTPGDSLSLSSNHINTLYLDRSGNLWIGAGSLNMFDVSKGKFITYYHDQDNPHSLSHNSVTKIYENKSGIFWIGTFDGGLNKFNKETGRFSCYKTENGLPDNSIKEILEDDKGNLWISTDNGLSKFNPADESFRNYDIDDGLPGIGMSKGYKSRTGELIFCSSNGMVIFHPDSIKDNYHIPPVCITGFSLFNRPVPIGYDSLNGRIILNKSITFSSELELNYDDNVFSFEFAALDFHAPEKNKYAYIMEGFDKEWTYTDAKRNFATYTNLNPGRYIFRVKGSNNDGIWNEEGTSLSIIIHPPWWRTNLAYFIYILFIAGIVFFTWKVQLRRIKIRNEYAMSRFEAQKLMEVDVIKSRFFTNISHEFRTPLTLIMGPAKHLLDEIKDDRIKSELRLINKHANKLLDLVNQLLDISKVESGSMKLHAVPRNIVSFVKALLLSFSSYADRKRISLEFSSSDEEITIYMDNDKLERIIINILSNAFKFTPEGGTVSLKLKKDGNEIKIIISDSGIGIPAGKISKIFDRFYQADASHTRKQEGTGIGLALTKELIGLCKGRIEVESEEGKGSTFTITLPSGKDHLKPEEIFEAGIESDCDAFTINSFDDDLKTDRIDISLLQEDSRHLVLIVEDNTDVRKYIKDNLVNEFRIIEAADGEEGWCKSVDSSLGEVDLVISDVMMPKMDGFELCNKLKTDERTSHIPVILLTAKAAMEDKLEGFGLGADEYLMKPFDHDELRGRVRNLIEQRKRLHEHFRHTGIFELENTGITSIDKGFLQKMFVIINKNLSDPKFGVESLSDSLCISRSVLHRKIVALTGESPGDLIRRIRMQKASQLIEQRFGNISEIALEVGFSNPSQFSRSFHNQFGITPSEYQRNNENSLT
jgi:signal transduction histidine kinase/ligand-binding sensor domain-containing protein/AraC-like DNA-binding protein